MFLPFGGLAVSQITLDTVQMYAHVRYPSSESDRPDRAVSRPILLGFSPVGQHVSLLLSGGRLGESRQSIGVPPSAAGGLS